MATYDFQCQTCGVVQEHIQSVKLDLPESLPCPRCGKHSEHVILTAPAISTGSMSQMTQDMAIGIDADKRWNRIFAKKEERDKVRRASGKQGIERKNGVYTAHDRKLDFVKTPEPKEG